MVKLSESKGKSGDSYAIVLGNQRMASLISKVQASVIRGGLELEMLLSESVPETMHTTLASLAEEHSDRNPKPPIQVIFKPSRPDPDDPNKSIQADLLVVENTRKRVNLIEIKDGYVFDTKKADGELTSLKQITSWLAQEFPYRTHYAICAFNQESKEEIVTGTKKRFSIEHVMTGQELCELIGIDYNEIRHIRSKSQAENRRYFLTELLSIPEICQEIQSLLKEQSKNNQNP